ncbi:MAG: FAD-dependent oxidoreductase, partial [Syntrophales bacterium]|nr:FAD-dependent oxidoreductase [Syntrophales bacterium]
LRVEVCSGVINLTAAPTKGEGTSLLIKGDAIITATGRVPNAEGLGLERAGVAFSPKGIPTDARMRTNIPHIYACGDINGLLPFTHVAGYEAGVALTNAILRLPRRADYDKIGWCTYTDPEVASIGLNEKRAQSRGIEYRIVEERFVENDRSLAEKELRGKIKLLQDKKERLLGCQIVGPRAGELIHEWIIAVAGGVKMSTMAGAVHIYPTLSEISKRVAGHVYADKLFSDRTKSILRFLFSLKGRACILADDHKIVNRELEKTKRG